MSIYSATLTGNPPIRVKSTDTTNVPFLSFVIPKSVMPGAEGVMLDALLTLSLPMPYAEGTDFPGIELQILCNGDVVAYGGFTYEFKVPDSYARVPVSITAPIKFDSGFATTIQAQWKSVRGSTMVIDSYASISAIVA